MATVLVVDDSRISQRVVSGIARTVFPDCDVVTAASGEAAIELVEQLTDDLHFALIDYNMPGMNGIECGVGIQALRPKTPMTLCTANGQQAIEDRAAEHGISVLHKPLKAESLEERLGEIVQRSCEGPESTAADNLTFEGLVLTEDQIDVLKESFNIGVGQAAKSLTQMIPDGGEIVLSVPEVELITIQDLASTIAPDNAPVCAVLQGYHGPFAGTAQLLYSAEESLQLARYMLQSETPLDDVSEMDSDALCEIGNIVLNSCISTFGNMFGIEIGTDVPTILNDSAVNILSDFGERDAESRVLYLRMAFNLSEGNLAGHLGFSMDVNALTALLAFVDRFLDEN